MGVGCSRYSAQHFGLSTSVAIQGAVVFHPILFKIGGGLHVRFSSTTHLGRCRGCSVASSDEMTIQASGDHRPRNLPKWVVVIYVLQDDPLIRPGSDFTPFHRSSCLSTFFLSLSSRTRT